jgi:hypothetical protein
MSAQSRPITIKGKFGMNYYSVIISKLGYFSFQNSLFDGSKQKKGRNICRWSFLTRNLFYPIDTIGIYTYYSLRVI